MSTIHISLTPKLSEYIQELLDTGLYSNVSEVVREALREKYQNETKKNDNKFHTLKQALQAGMDDIENERFSNDSLDTILDKIQKKQ